MLNAYIFLIPLAVTALAFSFGLGVAVGFWLAKTQEKRVTLASSPPTIRPALKGLRTNSEQPSEQPSEQGGGLTKDPQQIINALRDSQESLQTRLSDAEQKLASQSLEIRNYLTEARTDELTGLPNRRAIEHLAESEMVTQSENQLPLAIAITDIDHFKSINDRYGHASGDQTLCFVATQLRDLLPPDADVARFGGEEFLILMRNPLPDAFREIERIRETISAIEMNHAPQKIQVTISSGLCEIDYDQTLSEAIERADEALYQAKRGGRNCTYVHDGHRVTTRPS